MASELLQKDAAGTIPGTGFTKAHQLFRETVRRFVDEEINPHMDEWEEAEIFPAHDLFKKAGDLGLLGLSYPVEYGGSGGDYWYNLALAEELAPLQRRGDPRWPWACSRIWPRRRVNAIRIARAQEAVSRTGHSRRHGLQRGGDRGQRLARTWPRSAPRPNAMAMTTSSTAARCTSPMACKPIGCLLRRTTPGTTYKGMSLIVLPTVRQGFSVSKKLKKLGNWSSDTAELASTMSAFRWPTASARKAGLYLSDAAVPE